MGTSFEDLYIELIEHIVTYLELHDVASLRLTCRTIESKASQGCFTTFFTRKTIQLSTNALQDMLLRSDQGRLGRHLGYCTIVGIVQDGTMATAVDNTAEHSRLLTETLRSLKQLSPHGTLDSLGLRVAVHIDGAADGKLAEHDHHRDPWRAIWDVAIHTFNVTMAALEESQLPVEEHLDIFGSITGCSLACHIFIAFAQTFASAHVFRSLKKLTLSLSAPHRGVGTGDQFDGARDMQIQSQYITQVLESISKLRHAMPGLESLDLHWYGVNPEDGVAAEEPAPYQGRGVGSSSSSSGADHDTQRLKECSLHGIYITETNLVRFLQTTQPKRCTLVGIHLISGTYRPVFDYLTGQDSSVTYFHLDDLFEWIEVPFTRASQLVHFDVAGRPKFPYKGLKVGPSTLTRQGDDARETIHYRRAHRRTLGSPEIKRWDRARLQRYGPPPEIRRPIAYEGLGLRQFE